MLVSLSDLHRALVNDEIVPVFQPLVELRTGDLLGFEVLARWRHPELGLILPTNFIPLAEEYELAGDLMEQVFRKAFRSCKKLPKSLGLSVNISATQLSDSSLAGNIRRLAEDEGFSLSQLTVEITESALLQDLGRAKSVADDLRRLGFKLSLDDFGTGYSSLSHLHALSFDQLKIDRSFVAAMMASRESRKIVAAMVGLGHSLGLATVAEGVETEEQADRMLQLGCTIGQGWLYGRPAPAEKLPQMISAVRYSPCLKMKLSSADLSAELCLEALPTQRLSQLRAIYDGAPVGLCFLDMDLRHVSVNRRLADMNGASIKSHIGRHVSEVLGESYAVCEPYLRRAMLGEAIRGVEMRMPAMVRGGLERRGMVSYEPAFDEAGEVIGVSMAVIDLQMKSHPTKWDWRALRTRITVKVKAALTPGFVPVGGGLTEVGRPYEPER